MLRRTLAAFVATMILQSAAPFTVAQATSIGLYVDDIHYKNCVQWPFVNHPYSVWSWCLPSADGVQGASFAVLWHGYIDRGPVQINMSVVDHYTGYGLMTGQTFYYSSCQYDWHWIHKEVITIFLDDAAIRHYMWIEDGSLEHAGMVWRCGDQSWVPFAITTRAYFGHCTPIAAEGVSWGAIKSLCRE